MKRYSRNPEPARGARFGRGGDNQTGLYVIGAAISVVGLSALGGGDNPFSQFSEQIASTRLAEIKQQAVNQSTLKAAEESAEMAEHHASAMNCVKIVNNAGNGYQFGEYHVALSPGQRIKDPITQDDLGAGVCVQDHLGGVAILGDGGEVLQEQLWFSPRLTINDFFTNGTEAQVGQ